MASSAFHKRLRRHYGLHATAECHVTTVSGMLQRDIQHAVGMANSTRRRRACCVMKSVTPVSRLSPVAATILPDACCAKAPQGLLLPKMPCLPRSPRAMPLPPTRWFSEAGGDEAGRPYCGAPAWCAVLPPSCMVRGLGRRGQAGGEAWAGWVPVSAVVPRLPSCLLPSRPRRPAAGMSLQNVVAALQDLGTVAGQVAWGGAGRTSPPFQPVSL